MKKAILATKVGMTQIFNEDGSLIPVTVLQAGPCVVTQVKTEENDGYKAVQVGFVDKKDMQKSMHWEMKLRLTSSRWAIRLMHLLFPREKDFRVQSRDMVSIEDL